MKVIICDTYEEMSKKAAEIFIEQLKKKPDSVLGVATGSTVVGMYKELIKANERGEIDFSGAVTFNLDEYYKIERDDPNSFWQVMRRNLFDGVNIKEENVNILNYQGDGGEPASNKLQETRIQINNKIPACLRYRSGAGRQIPNDGEITKKLEIEKQKIEGRRLVTTGDDGDGVDEKKGIEEFCQEYEEKIKRLGGIDLQILGLGHNGHIGFNEPGSSFSSRTRLIDLTESTIEANSRFFKSKDEVPKQGLTMGIGTIMEARKIILVANGEGKAAAVAGAIEGPVSEEVPASVLQGHPEVTFILEKSAASLLRRRSN